MSQISLGGSKKKNIFVKGLHQQKVEKVKKFQVWVERSSTGPGIQIKMHKKTYFDSSCISDVWDQVLILMLSINFHEMANWVHLYANKKSRSKVKTGIIDYKKEHLPYFIASSSWIADIKGCGQVREGQYRMFAPRVNILLLSFAIWGCQAMHI